MVCFAVTVDLAPSGEMWPRNDFLADIISQLYSQRKKEAVVLRVQRKSVTSADASVWHTVHRVSSERLHFVL